MWFFFFLGCLAFWCLPCFNCKTAHEAGECVCLPLLDVFGCIPPIATALRVSVRQRYGIEVQTLCYHSLVLMKCNCVKHSVHQHKSQCFIWSLISLKPVQPFVTMCIYVPTQHQAIHVTKGVTIHFAPFVPAHLFRKTLTMSNVKKKNQLCYRTNRQTNLLFD